MLRNIARHLKEFKKDAVLTPILMILEVIVELLIPFLMASIIDDGVNADPPNIGHITTVGIIMLLFALAALIFGILGGKTAARAATGLSRNLREAMFNNIQRFSFSNIDRFSTPSLVTRLTTDVNNVQLAFQMLIRAAVRAPFAMITAMVMAFIISPRLATIYLVAVIALGCVLFLIIRKAVKHFRAAFPKYDLLNESIQENVAGIRVVKAYVREGYETTKLKNASMNIYRIFIRAEKIITYNMPVMMATVYACILLISWFGANMIVVDELSTGQLMSLLTYCMNILMSLMMLSMVFVMITMSTASAERINEVLEEEPDLKNPENPCFTVDDGSIRFDHVTFSYHKTSEKPVLQDITLDIRSGETIGIIGGTGSAKTTLVNMLSRLYDVDEGHVIVGGKDVREYDMESLRNQVSVVLQKNELFSGTILENLRWGNPDATLEEVKHVCDLACASEFIEKMPDGYDTKIEQGGTNVSGGQKQRLCIARALLKKPKILILDDSTSAVDTATDAKIRAALKDQMPETTKLIIAQRISSVEHADRVIVMDDGMINGFDTPENLLLNNEIYREVYETQTEGGGDFDENGGED